MPNEHPPARTGRPEAVRIPDQLQQTRRKAAPDRETSAERPREARRTAGNTGVLGQLETEPGHD